MKESGSVSIREVVEDSKISEVLEKAVKDDGTAFFRIIVPGWGSSGYYPADVLERDGPEVFTEGTQMFWDHATPEQESSRPEGSMTDYAAVLVEDAYWDAAGPGGPALYGKAKIFSDYQQQVSEKGPYSGVSIRGQAEYEWGEKEGRKGKIITKIFEGDSIDFVTRPGAGGQIQITESAKEQEKEDHMKLEQQLSEAVDRIAQLEEQNTQLQKQNSRFHEAMILRDARDFVDAKLANSGLHEVTKNRLSVRLSAHPPIVEGRLDTGSYETLIEDTIKEEKEYLSSVIGQSSGQITGMGQSTSTTRESDEDMQKRLNAGFAVLGLSESEAQIAVNGRKGW